MTLTNKDKKLLVYLLAICLVACSYFFVAKPLLDKQEKLSMENEELQTKVNYFGDYFSNAGKYQQEIADSEAQYEELLNKFFGGLEQDNTLVMIDGIENSTNVWISRISFQDSEVMINGSGSESVVTEETTESEEVTSETSESETTVALSGIKQDLNIDYAGSYSDFKGFLDYLNKYDKRLFISSLSAQYSADSNQVSGTIILSQYAIPGETEYQAPDLSSVNTGVNNIFSSLKDTSEMREINIEQVTAPGSDEDEISEETKNSEDGAQTETQQDEQAEEAPREAESEPRAPKGGGGII